MSHDGVLYTPEEVARKLRVTTRTIYTWLRDGRLEGERIGRLWRVSDEELEHLFTRPAKLKILPIHGTESLQDFAGCLEGPGDLTTNPIYGEDFGE